MASCGVHFLLCTRDGNPYARRSDAAKFLHVCQVTLDISGRYTGIDAVQRLAEILHADGLVDVLPAHGPAIAYSHLSCTS